MLCSRFSPERMSQHTPVLRFVEVSPSVGRFIMLLSSSLHHHLTLRIKLRASLSQALTDL
jgi:hypothetical protein